MHVEADLLDDVGDACTMKVKYSKTPTNTKICDVMMGAPSSV